MHVKSCFADSAQALVDITSPVADQHASMDANCVVHGRTAAARHKRKHTVVRARETCKGLATHLGVAEPSTFRYASRLTDKLRRVPRQSTPSKTKKSQKISAKSPRDERAS